MVVSAPALVITAPAQLIIAPAQPPTTGVVVYTALFFEGTYTKFRTPLTMFYMRGSICGANFIAIIRKRIWVLNEQVTVSFLDFFIFILFLYFLSFIFYLYLYFYFFIFFFSFYYR